MQFKINKIRNSLVCKFLFFIFTITLVIGCSGGGGSGGSSSSLDTNGAPSSGTVEEGKSKYYTIPVVESRTYQIILTSTAGDADIAVFNNAVLTDENIVVVSINGFSEDIVKFTATNTQDYHIEVAGFVDSSYSLVVSEVTDDQIGIIFSQDLIDFISVRNRALPSPVSVDLNLNGPMMQIQDTLLVGDTAATWVNFQVLNQSYQNTPIDITITSNTDPVGVYSASLRVYANNANIFIYTPYPSVAVYRDIEINYSLLNLNGNTEQVTYGESQEFQIETPSIPNSGIDISLLSAPTSMSLDSEGIISWIPEGPMFDTSKPVNWILRIQRGLATYDLTTTTLVNDALRERPLFRSPINTPARAYNASIGDFDGDGIKELLLNDSRKQVFTLEYNNNAYMYDWSLPFSLSEWELMAYENPRIQTLTSADVNSDGNPDIIIGYTSKIVILDGVTKRQISSFEDGFSNRREMMAARLTNSNVVTLVYLVPVELSIPGANFVYSIIAYDLSDLNSPNPVWQSEPLTFIDDWGNDHSYLTIGNVDQDANLEIISASGEIIDGQSFNIQDSFPIVNGEDEVSLVQVADVNADGIKDVLICCKRFPIYNVPSVMGYSVVDQSIIWSSLPIEPNVPNSFSVVNTIAASNIDQTPEEEILISANGNIIVYAHDPVTGLPAFAWGQDQVISAHTLIVDNIDEDPAKELIAIRQYIGVVPHFSVYEIGPSSLTPQWLLPTTEFRGSYAGGMWTNVAPNEPEAVFVNSDSSGYLINLLGLNSSGDMTVRSINANRVFTARSRIAKTDYDHDGIEELFLSIPDAYEGFLAAMDFDADSIEWQLPNSVGQESYVIKHADMNGDSFDDLVSLQSFGNTFYIYDVHNDYVVNSVNMNDVIDFQIVETNDADVLNIVFRGNGLKIYEYRRSTNQLTQLRASTNNSGDYYYSGDFLVADVNGDGNNEIIMRNGSEFRIKDFELNTLQEYTIDTNWASGRMYTENGSRSSKNILLTINTGDENKYNNSPVYSSYIRLIDAMSGNTIWESPALIGSAQEDSLNVIDSNNDGVPDFYTLGTTEGMYITK